MKIRAIKRDIVASENLECYFQNHGKEPMTITFDSASNTYIIIRQEWESEATHYMETLRTLADADNTLSADEIEAINYGISAIKQLKDMEIIK